MILLHEKLLSTNAKVSDDLVLWYVYISAHMFTQVLLL